MSRIAKKPITIPSGVDVSLSDRSVIVKGPKGVLSQFLPPLIDIKQSDGALEVTHDDLSKASGSKNKLKRSIVAAWGTARAVLQNAVIGVSQGFQLKLSLVGVGYRAQAQGNTLNISAGFSHPVNFEVPEGISIKTPTPTEIIVEGIDKSVVGEVAAKIRRIRPPEVYKGKGIRLSDEIVILKETKKK